MGVAPGAAAQTQKKLPMLTIGLIAALVVVVLFAGVALLGGRNGTASSSGDASSAQSGTSSSSSSSSSGSASACTTAPDADVTSIDTTDGNMMVATVRLSSSCSGSSKATFDANNTKIEITDSGSLVASAIFDFSADPIDLSSSSAQVKLAFKPNQYWTVPDQTSASSLSVSMGSASPADGAASSLGNGVLGGANALTNDERESDAHQALENQIEHDKSAANGFYTTYTTQLSSKRSGLNAEGKTWTYQDIWEEFLNFKERYPNALLIWSNDYPNYTKKGPSEWYVTLSGESFSSTDAADNWCSANGYDTDHCLPVDLS